MKKRIPHIYYKTKNRSFCFLLSAFLCSLFFLSGCASLPDENTEISKSGFYFNTVIKVTLYDGSKEHLLEECFALADLYEGYFSNTLSDSDISKINAAKGTPVEVHDETIELLKKGIYYGELSEGKFDVTIGNLSDLWDFSTKTLVEATEVTADFIPAQSEIDAALDTVSYKNIFIDGNLVALTHPDTKIDLGGIAKGYIADKMKAFLNDNGVYSGIINLGGNVLALGEKPDGSSYNIGIQRPFDESGAAIAAVRVTDETVVSSGVYERYFTYDGTVYHHLLNTQTGYPYDNGLLGVTIITKNSVDGDGLSTTCFALGLKKGLELIEKIEDTEAVFVTDDYKLHVSSGIGTTIPFTDLSE